MYSKKRSQISRSSADYARLSTAAHTRITITTLRLRNAAYTSAAWMLQNSNNQFIKIPTRKLCNNKWCCVAAVRRWTHFLEVSSIERSSIRYDILHYIMLITKPWTVPRWPSMIDMYLNVTFCGRRLKRISYRSEREPKNRKTTDYDANCI